MLIDERLTQIIQLVREQKRSAIPALARHLKVSEMTIRRDIDKLVAAGQLTRIRGGVQLLETPMGELPLSAKAGLNVAEKRAIAVKMAERISEDSTLYLGSGSTIELLVDELHNQQLQILTNSLPVYQRVLQRHPQYEATLIGGQLRVTSGMFVGGLTTDTLRHFNFDQAIISCDGLNDGQLLAIITEEGQSQQVALKQAVTRTLLVDQSKIGMRALYAYYPLSELDLIITNSLTIKQVKQLPEKVSRIEVS